jgi:arginyl-tRNA synthetase
VQVEFVSANPNGPITVAHGRGGAIGDSIASMLQATGYRVEREFYVNDALNSTQMVNFGRSVHFRYLQLLGKDVGYTDDAHLPDWLYRGDYVTDIARRIIEKIGDRYAQTLLGDPDLINVFRLLAQEGMQAQQDGDLTAFGIKFDRWFNESTLHESGEVKAAIDDLTKKGLTYESDGAIWLKSTLFNDDKDRVLMRANGTATYIAGDLAYHRDKFKRGYDLVIDVWGADHGGYVARTKAAVEASGVDPARLEILLFQLVRISKNGELAQGRSDRRDWDRRCKVLLPYAVCGWPAGHRPRAGSRAKQQESGLLRAVCSCARLHRVCQSNGGLRNYRHG